MGTKTAEAIKGIEDDEERQNKANLVKKHYLGHMRFIGELYKGELISIKIMLMCLPILIDSELSPQHGIDEEKVECFAKLMSVIGMDLELQSVSLKNTKGKTESFEQLAHCWQLVDNLIDEDTEPKVSNRIKFMLQDLIEMRDNGWIQRREEEKAKTLAQIHKDAAKEARRGSARGGMNRSTSGNNIRRPSMNTNDVKSIARSSSKSNIDADGFTTVPTSGINRSQSLGNFKRQESKTNLRASVQKPDKASRSVSTGGSFAAFNDLSSGEKKPSPKEKERPKKEIAPSPIESKVEYKSPEECGKKTQNFFKEYFVGGDTDDIVLSLHELIGAGNEGSIERGAKVIESGVLMVLEMKAENVEKFMLVLTRCIDEKKIEPESIVTGLNDPLEFLSDIAIDAPLATPHLVTILSTLVQGGSLKLDFLLDAPEYFRTDGNAAQLACKVLNKIGGDSATSQENLDVIEKLMTDSDRESFTGGAKEMLSC